MSSDRPAEVCPKRFPIQGGPSVPWSVMEPYESAAKQNHDQSLARLAERGGLSPAEAMCLVEGITEWRERVTRIQELEARWIEFADKQNGLAAEMTRLASALEAAEGERDWLRETQRRAHAALDLHGIKKCVPFGRVDVNSGSFRRLSDRCVIGVGETKRAAEELSKVAARIIEWMDGNGYSPEDQSFGARAALAQYQAALHPPTTVPREEKKD